MLLVAPLSSKSSPYDSYESIRNVFEPRHVEKWSLNGVMRNETRFDRLTVVVWLGSRDLRAWFLVATEHDVSVAKYRLRGLGYRLMAVNDTG